MAHSPELQAFLRELAQMLEDRSEEPLTPAQMVLLDRWGAVLQASAQRAQFRRVK